MSRIITLSTLFLLAATPLNVMTQGDSVSFGATIGDCSGDPSLANRTDIVLCEPWEETDWWLTGDYVNSDRSPLCQPGDPGCSHTGRLSNPNDSGSPIVDKAVGYTEVVSQVSGTVPCISGSCLRAYMPAGSSGSLTAKWLLETASLSPESLYLSYYIHLSPNWNTLGCSVPPGTTGNTADGGKFPGLSDERINSDPGGQCGNGGDAADGINCWSMRANFKGCVTGGVEACNQHGMTNASTRFGSYIYIFEQPGSTGMGGNWDSHPWHVPSGDGGTCASNPRNFYCGIGTGGMLDNDRWYQVEMFVQMNNPTPSEPEKADGIIRGWVDGVLSYEKTNAIFRIEGHDNLHVRTVWLNMFKGGPYGNCNDHQVHLDQLVLAQNAPVSVINLDLDPPAPPTGLNVQ